MIKKFINEIHPNRKDYTDNLIYSAGKVIKYKNGFMIGYEQCGAGETFSVGQPVYDEEGRLMGFLGIGLCDSLDYSCPIRVPVEHWTICLPTEHCVEGKRVFTYWQLIGTVTEDDCNNTNNNIL